MDFELSKLQKNIQKAARDFAKGEFDQDLALELDRGCEFPEVIYRKAAELGFIGMHFPEEYSGQDLGVLECVFTIEELCRKDSTLGSAVALASFGSECVLRFGNEELKRKFLPQVAEGRVLSGGAFADPDQGYALASVNTTTAKGRNELIINGGKSCVINGGRAGFYCILCRTNQSGKPEEEISMILIEANREGVSVIDGAYKMGLRMTDISDLRFEDVRIPAGNLIGQPGEGIRQTVAVLDESRIVMAALALGVAQGAFDRSLDYVRKREAFGKKILEFQVTQHKLAEMAAKIAQARLVTYRAAWNFDQGNIDPKGTSITKIAASCAAFEVASESVQLLGGAGYMKEYVVERFCRDAKAIELLGGTSEFLKNTIAAAFI